MRADSYLDQLNTHLSRLWESGALESSDVIKKKPNLNVKLVVNKKDSDYSTKHQTSKSLLLQNCNNNMSSAGKLTQLQICQFSSMGKDSADTVMGLKRGKSMLSNIPPIVAKLYNQTHSKDRNTSQKLPVDRTPKSIPNRSLEVSP